MNKFNVGLIYLSHSPMENSCTQWLQEGVADGKSCASSRSTADQLAAVGMGIYQSRWAWLWSMAILCLWSLCWLPVSAATISLAWDPNPATDQVTSYRVWQATDTNAFAIVLSTTNTTATVSNLVAGVTNRFYVTARNTAGDSPPSNTITNVIALPTPSAPTNLRAVAMSSTRIDLQWENTSQQDVVTIEKSVHNNNNFMQTASLPGNVSSFISLGLTPKTLYYYRVRSINGPWLSPYSNLAADKTLRF